jgi:hypothetical protein
MSANCLIVINYIFILISLISIEQGRRISTAMADPALESRIRTKERKIRPGMIQAYAKYIAIWDLRRMSTGRSEEFATS